MSRLLVFAVILVLAFCAQTPPLRAAELGKDASPEQVAGEAYARMQAGQWEQAAELFDPAALRQFREMMAPLMEAGGGEAMATMLLGEEATADVVKAMSDAEFLGRFMRTVMQRSGAKLERQDILGGVAEGQDRIHLVTRTTASAMGIGMTQLEVVTVHQTSQGWRLALSGKLDGMAQALRARQTPATVEQTPDGETE
ncbi:MAG: hypothetical protein E6Q88_10805 [Lysobacteraceae bacterium]|nr:MAG: hypothetical protein E6Q88_10805 [Xanthomonadaceae bacterium]